MTLFYFPIVLTQIAFACAMFCVHVFQFFFLLLLILLISCWLSFFIGNLNGKVQPDRCSIPSVCLHCGFDQFCIGIKPFLLLLLLMLLFFYYYFKAKSMNNIFLFNRRKKSCGKKLVGY